MTRHRPRCDAAQLLKIFRSMERRCYVASAQNYRWYGGRGIRVCEQWLNSPARFIEWAINHGFAPGLEIDRINGDGDYEPSNCRWVTDLENQRNKKSYDPNRIAKKKQSRAYPKSSQFCGVYKYPSGRITAQISVNRKRLRLGTFSTEQEAAAAYDKAFMIHRPLRGRLNFPHPTQGSK